MRQIILDTNFILTCIKQKIDFFEDLYLKGFEIIIPIQVIEELEKIANSKKKLHFKEDAKIAIKVLEKNKFKKEKLEKNYVDTGIINFAKKNKEVVIATLDREIKNKTKNPKMVIKNKKILGFE